MFCVQFVFYLDCLHSAQCRYYILIHQFTTFHTHFIFHPSGKERRVRERVYIISYNNSSSSNNNNNHHIQLVLLSFQLSRKLFIHSHSHSTFAKSRFSLGALYVPLCIHFVCTDGYGWMRWNLLRLHTSKCEHRKWPIHVQRQCFHIFFLFFAFSLLLLRLCLSLLDSLYYFLWRTRKHDSNENFHVNMAERTSFLCSRSSGISFLNALTNEQWQQQILAACISRLSFFCAIVFGSTLHNSLAILQQPMTI